MTQQKKASALDLMQRTVALVVTFGGMGNRRKVSTTKIEVDADKDWILVSKQLLDCEEYEAIRHLDGEVMRWLGTRALPSLLKRGIYLLPLAYVEETNERLEDFHQQRQQLVEKLVKVYRAAVKEAQTRLRDVFDASDYPSEVHLRRAYKLQWQYISFNTPASLQQVSRELYEQEKAKAKAHWVEARETITQMLRAHMLEMTNHLVEKLTPEKDGKKKIFRDSAVEKFNDFLATFEVRNVADDAQLSEIVKKAKTLLKGVAAQNLRTEEALRDQVQDGFRKIKAQLSGMVTKQPRRAIQLDDEAA